MKRVGRPPVAREKVIAHLERWPDDIFLSIREIARKVGVSGSAVEGAFVEMRRQQVSSIISRGLFDGRPTEVVVTKNHHDNDGRLVETVRLKVDVDTSNAHDVQLNIHDPE